MNEQATTPTEDKFPVKIEPGAPRDLKCELTKDEIVERAKRVSYLVREIAIKEEERDTAKKHANAKIEELEGEVKRLNAEIGDGATWKKVPIQLRYIYRTAEVHEVRLDTGEILDKRPMTDRERQAELPLEQQQSAPDESEEESDAGEDSDEDEAAEDGIVWPPTKLVVSDLLRAAKADGWKLEQLDEMSDGTFDVRLVFTADGTNAECVFHEGITSAEAIDAIRGAINYSEPPKLETAKRKQRSSSNGAKSKGKGK